MCVIHYLIERGQRPTVLSQAQGPELCTEQDLECRAGTLDTVKYTPWGLEREGWRPNGVRMAKPSMGKSSFPAPKNIPQTGNYRATLMMGISTAT